MDEAWHVFKHDVDDILTAYNNIDARVDYKYLLLLLLF